MTILPEEEIEMNFYGAQQEDEESEEIEIHLAHPKATIAETKKYIE